MDFWGPDSNHRVLVALAIIFMMGMASSAARAAHFHAPVLHADAVYTGSVTESAATARDAHRKSTTVPDLAQGITLAAGFSLIGIAVGARRRHLATRKRS